MLALLAAGSAAAKQADANTVPQSILTNDREAEILVVGTRASLQSAIARKKNAETTVDSIVADDIASFPDKNIGEALSRVTGVQLTRDFGEGTQVAIRGVEPDLNRVEINGATTLGQTGSGQRGADFRELASELVKSIDVFKGFTADMTEGGVGGTVSIQTRRPLDLRKPIYALTASAQHLDVSGDITPRANLTIGQKSLFGSRLGFIVNLTYDNALTRNDYLRNTSWVRLGDLNGDNRKITSRANFDAITTLAGCNAVATSAPVGQSRADCQQQFYEFIPRIPRYGTWLRDDKRISGVATLQYAVADNFDVYAEYQRNRRDQQLVDYNRSVDVTALARINRGPLNNCATCVIDDEGNLLEFSTAATASANNTGAGTIFSTSKRDFRQILDSDYRTLGFNWDVGRLQLKGFGVKSKGTTTTESQSISLNATIPNIRVSIDPASGIPTFAFPTGSDPENPATYLRPGTPIINGTAPIVLGFQYRPEIVDVTEDQFKIDADFAVGSPFLTTLEFGGQYRQSTSVRYAGGTNFVNSNGQFVPTPYITSNVQIGATNTELAFPTSATNPGQGTSQTFTADKFQRFLNTAYEYTPGPFFPSGDRTGLPDRWLSPNFEQFGSFFDTQYRNLDRVRSVNGIAQTPAHEIIEDIYAAYLKGSFAFEPFGMRVTGNYGVRYVKTIDAATGSNTRRVIRITNPTTGATETATVAVDTISFRNRYQDWLPTFNISAEPMKDVFLRFGYAKVMARPRPTDLVPNINCVFDTTPTGSVDTQNDSCAAGNPDLKPYRADQFDLNIGWYPNRDTLLSAAFFYKDIKSYIITGQRSFNVDVFGDGQLFDVTRPINGQGAKLKGVEISAQTALSFLPAPLDGFGVQGNMTINSASGVGLLNALTLEPLPFPQLSKVAYTLIGYYDKGFLNARAAYTWRDKYLITVTDLSGFPVFRDATGYLDAKVTLRFLQDRLQFFVEGKNLTGQEERATAGSLRLTELAFSGKRFFAGISVRY